MGVKPATKSDATPTTPAGRPCEPSLDQMLDYLVDETGKSQETIQHEIAALEDKYRFLTPLAAAYLVGQQHGLQPAEAFETAQRSYSLDIDVLQPEMNTVDLTAEVAQITAISEFTRDDGSDGKVCNIILTDDTGKAVLTLWDAEVAVTDDIGSGDMIRVENGYSTAASDYCASRFDAEVEVRLGDDGSLLQKQDGDWTTVNE